MAKIKVLSEKMTKLISAGEVVEKPASIVKELVENCIDAGAKSIVIEIESGGQSKIVISDDGCGMGKDDILMSVLPHATSKVENPQDLDAILTLGFRGEALSSISAVSEVTIMSKVADEESGYLAKFDEGKIIDLTEINCEKGTRIEVSNLFYNTPARLKFLRKPKSDESDITDFVERLILAYSDISFKYYIDGKLKFNTIGSGLKDNIYTIYGSEAFENLIEIDETKNQYHLHGFIGRPEIAKPNRNFQTLIIGKRYVKNQLISTCISNAFENFLMKGKFPFYVLFLDLPADSVDVNIHPTKMEVKFENSNFIYGFVLDAVSKALFSTNYTKNVELIEPKKVMFEPVEQNIEPIKIKPLSENFGVSYSNKNVDTSQEVIIKQASAENDFSKNFEDTPIFDVAKTNQGISFEKTSFVDQLINDVQKELSEKKLTKNNTEVMNFVAKEENYQVIGRLFDTYIIIQNDTDVLFVDQHAAHERILFDKFMEEIENQQIIKQDLLFPYAFELKDKDFEKISNLKQSLQEMGFEITQFGDNAFKISSVPLVLQNISLKDFSEMLLAENFVVKTKNELVHDKIATLACKSAVKGGDELSKIEIDYIVKTINQGILLCPHGRPFVVKVTKTQFEKWFGRKV